MADYINEIKKRRTFAIISHPDAGKTTLTEKFLLYGGAIRLAGSVKARKASTHAVSDWMEIEKQRGISVTSSVMQFNYAGHCINILDTPGHQDFSEDTYRTLMAADSAVMVVDAAKGVEDQTRKLFHVCSLREMPIFTFINKMDREAQDPFGLLEDIELLDIAGDELDMEKVRLGELTPVFFGSALTNFGVEPFLEHFLQMTTSPLARNSNIGEIDPFDDKFSAFVFKIQANMNKAHRDRIAFMRICSGKFTKGEEVFHMQGGKKLKLAQPQQFMAENREIVEEAYAGDIIGVFDPGIFSIGDTLCSPSKKFKFEGIPTFAPEHFARVRPVDTMKRKQFVKGVTQIAQEGAIQVFKENHVGMEEIIVGVVGVLQFEVLEYRLKNEYNVEIKMDRLPFRYVRWIESYDGDVDRLNLTSDAKRVKDFKDRDLIIFQNDWGINWALDHNSGLVLSGVGKSDE